MAMIFGELVQAGIEKESSTEAFYRQWGPKVAEPGAKILLEELADEEAKHRIFFENLTEKDITDEPVPQVMDLHISDYLVSAEISEDSSTQDILISAIKREDSAIKFFTDLSGQAGKLQSTFQRLAAEEKKHKLRLETFYDDHILSQG